MGHVGGQVATLPFGFLQAFSHGVEAVGQFPYLGGSPGIGALRQVAVSQPPGRCPQALERGQRTPRQQPYQQRSQSSRTNACPEQGPVHYGGNVRWRWISQHRTLEFRPGYACCGNRERPNLFAIFDDRELFRFEFSIPPAP